MKDTTVKPQDCHPNTPVNIAIALSSYGISAWILYEASRAGHWSVALIWAFAFSFINNTNFSLLHESVHRSFSANRGINNWFGRFSSAFFPTGFNLQRGFHLGHHRRNRTDAEMFDMYYPTDNRFFKYLQWYSIFTGFYWASTPFAALMYLIWPGFFNLSFFKKDTKFGYQTGSEAMFSSLEKEKSPIVARLEIVFSFSVQLALFYFLNLDFSRWLLCYWVFGMNWGALQYADHAWSVRDIRHGAWNLKVATWVRLVFLNYHLHHAHHAFPTVPWAHLPKFVDPQEPQPSFWKIYLEMWKGPKLATEENPRPLDLDFIQQIEA